MQQFSIKQLEELSGIKAHTIRIWEKRYNLIAPDRTDGKHRIYTNDDLKSILRVVYLYKKGLKISKIAMLKEQEMLQKINAIKHDASRYEEVLPELMGACIDLDANRVTDILADVEAQVGLEQMMCKLVYPFLEQLGRAWVTGKILPNNEHFISHIITTRIILAISRLKKPEHHENAPRVLLLQPTGEYHEIPLLFINYLLCKNGCKTVYFGSNVSMEAIAGYCNYKPVSHIHYHLITNLGDRDTQEWFDTLAMEYRTIAIVASGPGVKNLKENFVNQQILKSQQDILDYIMLMGDTPTI